MEALAKKRRLHEETENQDRGEETEDTRECETGTPIALKLPEILKQIFKHLPTSDLLTCSLVSKAWNYESRCLLRDNRTLVAVIKGPDPCMKLLEFETLLSSMNLVPYTGLRVCVTSDTKNICCLRALDLESLYPSALKMNLKYLQIDWRDLNEDLNHDGYNDCAAILFLRECLRQAHHLEQCDILSLPESIDLYSFHAIDKLELPNLRILKLPEDECQAYVNEDFRLVKAAPKLEKLYSRIFTLDRAKLSDEKIKCITNLDFTPQNESHLDFLEKIALSGTKLEKLHVYIDRHIRKNILDRMWRVLQLLLERCCKESLSYLYAELVVAVKLMSLQVPLDGLETLEIVRVYRHHEDRDLIPLLGNIDLPTLFPALKCLKLDSSDRFYDVRNLESCLTAQELAQRDQFSRIYHGGLVLTMLSGIEEPTLRNVAATFPNIRSLDVDTGRDIPSYALLWELWPGLERLKIGTRTLDKRNSACLTPFLNLDAEFCGISPEEAAVLQEMDDGFLEKVHIVPTRPAITTMKNLRAFNLHVKAVGLKNRLVGTGNLLLLSKVTGHIAFRRMAGVEFRLEVFPDILAGFDHLIPFVNLIGRDLGSDD